MTDSLGDVHSIRDFIMAVQTGSQVATGMLDDIESTLMRRTVDEDQ